MEIETQKLVRVKLYNKLSLPLSSKIGPLLVILLLVGSIGESFNKDFNKNKSLDLF